MARDIHKLICYFFAFLSFLVLLACCPLARQARLFESKLLHLLKSLDLIFPPSPIPSARYIYKLIYYFFAFISSSFSLGKHCSWSQNCHKCVKKQVPNIFNFERFNILCSLPPCSGKRRSLSQN